MTKPLEGFPDPDQARNVLIQIVTAARKGDAQLAQRLTKEYEIINASILPLFISALAMIETVLNTVAQEIDMPADELWQGIALGLTIKQMEAKNQQKEE